MVYGARRELSRWRDNGHAGFHRHRCRYDTDLGAKGRLSTRARTCFVLWAAMCSMSGKNRDARTRLIARCLLSCGGRCSERSMRLRCVRPKRSTLANWHGSGPRQRRLLTGLSPTSSGGRMLAVLPATTRRSRRSLRTTAAFQHLLELMEARKIDRSVVDGYDAIFQRAIAAGHLHDDFAALSRFLGKSG